MYATRLRVRPIYIMTTPFIYINYILRRCFARTGCLVTADGWNDEVIRPQGFPENYYKTIDEEEIASAADDDDSVDQQGQDDETGDVGNRRGEDDIEFMEDAGEYSMHDEDFVNDEDATSAEDRDFDEQLPAGWEPVDEMPELTKLKGESIMFRWGKDGWRKGVVKKSDHKKLTKDEREKGMTHVVSYKDAEARRYCKYPQRLDEDAYKWSADAVAGCWVVIRKTN